MWESFIPDISEMEYMAKQVIPDIKIVEERGLPDGTCFSKDKDGHPVLHWDALMYDYYEKELVVLDTLQFNEEKDERIATEMAYNYTGILLDHLAEKNKRNPYLYSALKKKANDYNYPFFEHFNNKLPEVSEWKVQYFIQTGVLKLLIMYHELGHCLFSIDQSERDRWEGLVIGNLELLLEVFGDDVFVSGDDEKKKATVELIKRIIRKEKSCRYILEELAADSFALSKAYASTHLNITAVDKLLLSDHIMLSYLRYTDISSQYSYMVEYWKELYGMCIVHKKKSEDDTNEELWERALINGVRCEFFPVTGLMNILQWDEIGGFYHAPEGISFADPRVRKNIRYFTINADLFGKIVHVAVSPILFNSIVDEAYELEEQGIDKPYEYPEIPDEAIIITWTSLQYHNSIGLQHLNERNYALAAQDFRTAAAISERYLGLNHRFTARSHNNICSCYLGMIKYGPHDDDYKNSLEYHEKVELASLHSSAALEILKACDDCEEMQAGTIYQNVGEVLTLAERFDEALEQYYTAKRIKEKNLPEYEGTHAITDHSIASVYFVLKRYADAKRALMPALIYCRNERSEDDPLRMEAEDLYAHIENMMSTSGGAIFDIMSTLFNGGTVNLDQYNDFEELGIPFDLADESKN